MTIDNKGEGISASYNVGRGTQIELIKEIRLPHSLGMLYLAFTFYLGFGSGDEYKVMGLASYGEPEYYDVLKDILQITKAHGHELGEIDIQKVKIKEIQA